MANKPYTQRILDIKLQRQHCAGDIGDEWQTPALEFKNIERLAVSESNGGKFSIDLFASEANAKCEHYFTAEDNALKQDWGKYAKENGLTPIGFANPPYSKPHVGRDENGETCTGLKEMMHKAYNEMRLGFHSVWLLPCNPEADWFPHDKATNIYFVTDGRLTFDSPSWYKQDPDGSKPSSARGGAVIVIFDPAVMYDDQTVGFVSRKELRREDEENSEEV